MSVVLEEEGCRRLAEQVLAASRADQTEVVLLAEDSSLTRFAASAVHQNVHEVNAELRLRLVVGKRVGVAATNDLSPAGLEAVVARAADIAARQREDPDFPGLSSPRSPSSVAAYHQATADYAPIDRARAVKTICDLAVENGLVASGALSTGSRELAVANSLGLWAYQRSTSADLKTVIMGEDDAAGYAERATRRVDELDFEALGREAADKARRGRGAISLEPGEYPVLLEEYAVGEALSYLSYMGFGALAFQEGHSFLCDRLGERVMDQQISIWDDGTDPRGLPSSFDFEGVPKQRVSIIEQGVARGVVYDSRTAARAGTQSTGHALPAPSTFGPFAWNLFMAPGQTSKEQLLASVKRGLSVTRFHYVNVLHPRKGILTGMTRDGTFLIENGELSRPVRNFRFTQSMPEALSNVGGVGSQVISIGGFFGATVVPALLLGRFNFTGVSALPS